MTDERDYFRELSLAIAAGDHATVNAIALELAAERHRLNDLVQRAAERRERDAERKRQKRATGKAQPAMPVTSTVSADIHGHPRTSEDSADIPDPSLPPCPPSPPPTPSLSPPYNPPSHPKNAAPISAPGPAEPSLFAETQPAEHDSSQSPSRLNDVGVAAAPEPPKRSRGVSKHWLIPVAREWEAKMGAGSFPWAKAGHALKPLERAGIAADAIAANLARYLDKTDPRYTNLARFAETFAAWDDPGPLVDANGVLTPRGMAAFRGAA